MKLVHVLFSYRPMCYYKIVITVRDVTVFFKGFSYLALTEIKQRNEYKIIIIKIK